MRDLKLDFLQGICLQGSAIGVGSWFTRELIDEGRVKMSEMAGVGAKDVPFVIASMEYI